MKPPDRAASLSPREHLARLLEAAAGKTPHTPAEELRALLRELEIRVANMEGVGDDVIHILEGLDQATDLLYRLEESGVDVQAEAIRLAGVQERLRRKAPLFLKEIGGARRLRRLREERHPPRNHTWWYLDEWVAQQRRRRLRRIMAGTLLLLIFLALAYAFIQSRLPRDPRARRILDLQMALDTAMEEGDWQQAVRVLEELRTLDPDNPTYIVQLGVLYEHLGEEEKAHRAYERARALVDEGTFYKLRAMTYLQVGAAQAALEDAQRAVKALPEDPEAYFYLGNAYELLGRLPEALDAYEQAAQRAQKQKRDALLAVIRMRMAAILQRPPLFTPTP